MPMTYSPNMSSHDEIAIKLQPYFIDKMLIDTHHEHHLFRQLIAIMAKNFGTKINHTVTNAQENTINQQIVDQYRITLEANNSAILESKLMMYQKMNDELLNAINMTLSSWVWSMSLNSHAIGQLKQYAKGANVVLPNRMFELFINYFEAWQLQVLNLEYIKGFNVRPFNLTNPQLAGLGSMNVNLYEMGLTELPNDIWVQWLINHIDDNVKQIMTRYGSAYNKVINQPSAYQMLQTAYQTHKLIPKDRQVIQNVYIDAKTRTNPAQISSDDRQYMFYQRI